MRFYRFRWEEDRGGQHAEWGPAVYWFAVADGGIIEQQFEVYDDGHVLMYDQDHLADEFGMLPDQHFDPEDAVLPVEQMTAEDYDVGTSSLRPFNR